MANEQNLVQNRSREEAEALSRKGGVASGRVRRQKRDLRESMRKILELDISPKQKEQLESLGINSEGWSLGDVVNIMAVQTAMKGNVSAMAYCRDTAGFNPELQLREAQFEYEKKQKSGEGVEIEDVSDIVEKIWGYDQWISMLNDGVPVLLTKQVPYRFSDIHLDYIRKCQDNTYNILEGAVRSGKTVDHPFMQEVPLETIKDWAGLAPQTDMDGIERPFFLYIKVPRANNVDSHSPLGASVFSRAVEVIEAADKQYSRILWEYEAKEAAVDAASDIFDIDKNGNPVLPKGKERLFRTYDTEGKNNNAMLQVYSPEIRDSSMFRGLNEFLRRIEFLCGLAYGTLSNEEQVDRTATEIKASKQRSYTTVSNMQKAWDRGLDDIIEIMNMLCDLYDIVPPGDVQKTCSWGDGVLEDTEVEYQRRWSMVLAGKLKIEKFYAWYFGCTEEEAKEYIPEEPQYPPDE